VERVRGRLRSSFIRSWVASLAMDCKEDSFVRKVGGTGFGSKAVRLPRSKDSGIALCGLRDLNM
jgi:hypothetical protein